MKLAILSGRPDLYSTRRLLSEATSSGFTAEVIDYRQCSLGIGTTSRVVYRGREIHPHVVLPRIGHRSSSYGAAVIRQFGAMNVPSTLQPGGLLRARDKFATLQALAAAGIPVPATGAARSPTGLAEVLDLVGGVPAVVKLLEGTHGSGVVLAETRKAAESLLAAFHQIDADICVQEFVKDAAGVDLRAFVIDGQVVAAMERVAAAGEFRANIHQGGHGKETELSEDERGYAVAAAAVVGLNVAGVDILRSGEGPLVIEVNASPGLQGIERVTGRNVAAEIVAYSKRLLN